MKRTRQERFSLRPEVARWLDATEDGDDEECDAHFDSWLERVEDSPQTLVAGKVKVDRAVLEARFACVPERCAPWADRGRSRSCCADIFVPLTPAERRRLRRQRHRLAEFLRRREPRLRSCLPAAGNPGDFFLDDDGDALEQPGGRCVFSQHDRRGRIRCRLYAFAKSRGIDTSDVQPYTCRVFPLVLVKLERGMVLLTVLNKGNYRGLESLHPNRLPCLSDPGLPPLYRSMAGTLDWLFGAGFARWLGSQARAQR